MSTKPQYVPVTYEAKGNKRGVGVAKVTKDPETGVLTVDMRILDGDVVEALTAKMPLGVSL
jgi:hypothetical protein